MVAAAAMSVPTSSVPVVSTVTWTISGRLDARVPHRDPGAVDRGLGLERVLAGLAEDDVGAARDQARGLDAERLLEGAVGDVAERGQAGAGADRADHEALAAVACDQGDRLMGELGRAPVDLERPLAEVELAERDRRAAEAVGLERIGAGLEIAEVDLPDQVRAAQVQDLGAVLLAPEVGLDREVAALDLGPHGAIDQKDPALEGLEKSGCHAVSLRRRGRGAAADRAAGRPRG